MKKSIIVLFTVIVLNHSVAYSLHPKARSAITAIQNQLQHLRQRYSLPVQQAVQANINLLYRYDATEAEKYQQALNSIAKQATQGRTGPYLAPENIPQQPPLTGPQVPPAPTYTPATAPGKTTPAPSDMPPAPPAPSYAPPALPQDIQLQKDVQQLKRDLNGMQQRTFDALQELVPVIKTVDDAGEKTPVFLRELLLQVSRKNSLMKSKMKEFANQHIGNADLDEIFNVGETFTAIKAIERAIQLYTILSGEEAAEKIQTYFEEIRSDFANLTSNTALETIAKINQIIENMGPLKDALTPDSILESLSDLFEVSSRVQLLSTLHVKKIGEYVAEGSSLDTKLNKLFASFKSMLTTTKNMFSTVPETSQEDIKMFYELTAQITKTYMSILPTMPPAAERAQFYKEVQDTIKSMGLALVKQLEGVVKK